jgi:hypothetical protein
MNPETEKNALSHNPVPLPVDQPISGPADNLHPVQSLPTTPSPSVSTDSPQPPRERPVFSAAAPENQEAILDSRIDSIARRQRADSFLRSLTPEQARQVYTWVRELDSINEVQSRITAPPPEGLGLTVSTITLRRLRALWQAQDEINFTQNMLDIITDMEVESELKQPARIQNAICHLLQEKAFDLAIRMPGSEVLKDVLSGIEKLTTLDLKRQKLQLERERLLRRSATPAPAPPTQHHRVDLNIVPPNSVKARQPVVQSVMHTDHPNAGRPQLEAPPSPP